MKRELWFRVFGIIVFFIVILQSIYIGGGPRAFAVFIDVASLLFIVIIPLAMCIFAGLGSDYLRAYKIAFGNTKYTLKENQSSSIAIGLMIKIVYLSGIIGSLVGTVQVLRFLNDPANFGVAISVAGLTLFYALFINIIQHAIKARVDKEVLYKEN